MWRNARVLTTPPSKQNRVPLKTSDKKSPYDPRAPITNSFCKSSSCIFVCLIATAARGENGSEERANPGEMWQSHEHFSWRGGNEIERSYCWTPSSIETLDQNGRLQGSAAFSLYSSWSPANWSYLAGRSNFCLLPRVLRRVHRLLWCPFPAKFGTCRRGTSWGLEPPQRRRGHSSSDAGKELNSLISKRVVTAADVDRKNQSAAFISQQVQVKFGAGWSPPIY